MEGPVIIYRSKTIMVMKLLLLALIVALLAQGAYAQTPQITELSTTTLYTTHSIQEGVKIKVSNNHQDTAANIRLEITSGQGSFVSIPAKVLADTTTEGDRVAIFNGLAARTDTYVQLDIPRVAETSFDVVITSTSTTAPQETDTLHVISSEPVSFPGHSIISLLLLVFLATWIFFSVKK